MSSEIYVIFNLFDGPSVSFFFLKFYPVQLDLNDTSIQFSFPESIRLWISLTQPINRVRWIVSSIPVPIRAKLEWIGVNWNGAQWAAANYNEEMRKTLRLCLWENVGVGLRLRNGWVASLSVVPVLQQDDMSRIPHQTRAQHRALQSISKSINDSSHQ